MNRKQFIQRTILGLTAMSTLKSLSAFSETLPIQSKKMPVLFTSHGNPMDIIVPKEEREFWMSLYKLGLSLQKKYEIKAALVISAHWCTRGTFVNTLPEQKQIFDYYGFPDEYYKVAYQAQGAPEIAHEVKQIVPSITETTEWGLDHGAWPMLMHLFPSANVPVFQLSIDYYAKPQYHYDLGEQLKSLRQKGVLIIGSGALIHNIQLAASKIFNNDLKPYGWEGEYDEWIKKQVDARNINNLINYQTSHKLAQLAAPTPDHFVPILYSMGLLDAKDHIRYFYEAPSMPAFSERSFIIEQI